MAEVLWPIINDNCLHKYLCDEPKQSGGRTKHLHSIQQSINSFNEKWGERGAAPKSEDLAHRFERIAHFSTRRPFTKADLNEVMLLAPLALHTSARTHTVKQTSCMNIYTCPTVRQTLLLRDSSALRCVCVALGCDSLYS